MRTELASHLPGVTADRVQLQQVLMNLMLNAIEAMRDRPGELTIKTEAAPGDQVLISVSDTGVGLPNENTEQIFNAFLTTKSEGSGMGLAISRSIVESHGGRLLAAANSGQGATFHFTLPTAADELKCPLRDAKLVFRGRPPARYRALLAPRGLREQAHPRAFTSGLARTSSSGCSHGDQEFSTHSGGSDRLSPMRPARWWFWSHEAFGVSSGMGCRPRRR
jgi:Histidine kinase-, DNA gyrase B-, and HSP90-like ATPase